MGHVPFGESEYLFEFVSKLLRHDTIQKKVECRVARQEKVRNESNHQNAKLYATASMKIIFLFLLECQSFVETQEIAKNVTDEEKHNDSKKDDSLTVVLFSCLLQLIRRTCAACGLCHT